MVDFSSIEREFYIFFGIVSRESVLDNRFPFFFWVYVNKCNENTKKSKEYLKGFTGRKKTHSQ
jgi:hypothetical protein